MQGMARKLDDIESNVIAVDGELYAIWEDSAGRVVIEGYVVEVER